MLAILLKIKEDELANAENPEIRSKLESELQVIRKRYQETW